MEPEKYYAQMQVAKKILEFCQDREVVGRTKDGAYGTRPNMLQYVGDLLRMVPQFYSFHGSLERWNNPMAIGEGAKLDTLRKGWDLVIDLDGTQFEVIRTCGQLVIEALYAHGINSVSVKFSGNKGFHIGVPFESFPQTVDGVPTARLFPELPRRIALYLKEFIFKEFQSELSVQYTAKELSGLLGKKPEEVTQDGKINPWAAVSVDTIVVSPRHLIRAPYSLHEKSGLVSTPLKVERLKSFKREDAQPEKVKSEMDFLSRDAKPNEAQELVSLALSTLKREKKSVAPERKVERPTTKLPAECFPPCIKNILLGLKDGRKRSEFILRCFLYRVGWDWKEIEELLLEWNKKNPDPLKENYLLGQLRWHIKQNRDIMPPNCDNESYYKEFRVCDPDKFCQGANNPVVSALRRMKEKTGIKNTK